MEPTRQTLVTSARGRVGPARNWTQSRRHNYQVQAGRTSGLLSDNRPLRQLPTSASRGPAGPSGGVLRRPFLVEQLEDPHSPPVSRR